MVESTGKVVAFALDKSLFLARRAVCEVKVPVGLISGVQQQFGKQFPVLAHNWRNVKPIPNDPKHKTIVLDAKVCDCGGF